MNKKIIMLCSECFSTSVLYNYISRYYTIEHIITEDPLRGMALAKRRIKKLGFIRVAGQVLFSGMIVPFLRMTSRKRIQKIKAAYPFDETALPANKKTHFSSVNQESCIQLLKEFNPDIVVVNGTRIISSKVLGSTNAVFINMHTGITPKYRGVHGGYWALVNNDKENCGVTIHVVDKGVDTGGILYQSTIPVTRKDNFITYPYLQFGEGLPLIKKAIDDIINNKVVVLKPGTTESKLWYHPTIWQYLFKRIFKAKK
jgi:folate-dependent phosphoribosylglycinamide formyltransferase PurN